MYSQVKNRRRRVYSGEWTVSSCVSIVCQSCVSCVGSCVVCRVSCVDVVCHVHSKAISLVGMVMAMDDTIG